VIADGEFHINLALKREFKIGGREGGE